MGLDLGGALSIGSAALGVAKGLGDLIGGHSEEKKIQADIDRLQQPFYKIQNEYVQNRNIGANLATSGLPEETKNYYTTQSEKGLGAGLGYLNQAGGTPNDAARLFDIYNNSISKVAAEDATQRVANIQNFFNLNKELAGQKTMKWALDEYQPYQRKLKELTERMAAAKINANNGANLAIGSLGATGTALSNNDLMSKLFSNTQSGTSNYVAPATNQIITSAGIRQPSATIQPIQQNIPIGTDFNFQTQGNTLDAGTNFNG